MDFLKNFFPLCQFLYYSTPYSSVCALSSYKITVLPRYRPLLLGTYELDLKLLLDKYMCIAITITLSTRQLETDTTIVYWLLLSVDKNWSCCGFQGEKNPFKATFCC